MSETVISVENLGKKYILGHQMQGEYETLRDKISNAGKSLGRKLASTLNGKRISNAAREEFWALRDVSFEIKQGEVVGIIGRNGAGKSTLLKILSRITEPTTGEIAIAGRVASLLEVGTGFHPELTGRENIYLNGAILGMSKNEIKRKFDEIVAFSEVEKFLDTPVKRYSSGMYVRLAFAVAAHLEPEILIVDEVLAVGDAAFQKKCLGKMDDVAKTGRTVLFVSHNMAAVQALCRRGILLQNGIVWRDATATEAIGTYLRSLEQAASQSLLERKDRAGKGQVRLSRVDVCTNDADSSNTLATGRSAQFIFHLTAIFPPLACVFTIYDQSGQAVANFNSAVHSPEDSCDAALGPRFICHLDELPLVPGRYRINVAISDDSQLEDHVEAAAIFDVEQGTLRGRPVSEDTGYGSVMLPHRWKVPC